MVDMLDRFPTAEVAELCRRWQVVELALFGSALGDDFRPDSDIDLLVTWAPDAHLGLFAVSAMVDDLQSLLGRRVDLVDRRAVERSPNWSRRNAILSSARTIYQA
jgi:predicted nucleotidyltransferase